MPTKASPKHPVSSKLEASSPLADKQPARAASLLTAAPPFVFPSPLQPRVAVVLKVPPPWHPWLFALRLGSILPALWWGLHSALRILVHLFPGNGLLCHLGPLRDSHDASHAVSHGLTEGALANIWCFACGYLSFFFTDFLMSRWLINYTPQATVVRLLTINAVNSYVTLNVLSLTGGFDDPRLLLPGWIGIAMTPTVCYHITQKKINIRKETSTSINLFSIASYITMVILFVRMHSNLADYPTMPVVDRARHLWSQAVGLLMHIESAMERAEL